MYPKHKILSLATLVWLGCSLLGQLQAQNSSFPTIMIKEEGGSRPLHMDELSIRVEVVGAIATTTMEMSFFNATDRILEGQFYFPLGEGQTVSRFALDVNGQMREGVVVEKEKGEMVFESVVRRNIDPGLLEWTKGENFKARIYPIPAHGHKRLLIAFEQELKSLETGNLYLLPLNFKEKVDKFNLKVEVFKQKIAPRLDQNQLANLTFKNWQENYVAEMHEENYLPNKQLGFVLPRPADYQQIFVEKDENQKSWFYLQIQPPVISRPRTLPKDLVLVWDASSSAAARNLQREFALLDKYFKEIGNAKIHLITFAHLPENEKIFFLSNGNWDLLKSSLEKIPFDGGTSLGALDLQSIKTDEFILCSDGISNFGPGQLRPVSAPIRVINSAPVAEHSYLKFIAAASGGQYLNLNRLSTDEAFKILMGAPYQYLGAKYSSVEVTDVYPSLPREVQGDFSLAGQLKTGTAEITLNFGINGEVLHTERIRLNQSTQTSETGKVRRLWAQKKLAELLLNPKANADRITQLGKEYTIVTPNTSLIVLDRLEDYVQFQIVPPKEMQSDYFAQINQLKEAEKRAEQERLDQVAAIWKERIEHWEKTWPMDTPPPSLKESKAMDDGFGDWGGSDADDFSSMEMDSAEESVDEGWGSEPDVFGNSNAAPSTESGKKEEAGGKDKLVSSIEVKNWDPDEPYLRALKETAPENRYPLYLELKKQYGTAPSFYLDVADYFRRNDLAALAMRVLSNLAELELENHRVLRIMAHRLIQLNRPDLAAMTFEEVRDLRPDEPQSYRDLGLALARAGKNQEAIEQLYEVIRRPWDERFNGIELISLEEINTILATSHRRLETGKIDSRLLKNLTSDVRVVLDWDADNCDMDLWVIDPNGERCYYGNRVTYMGGYLTDDMTGGYGPEAYMLHKAKAGNYVVKVKYYADYQQSLVGPTTLHLTFYSRFGTSEMKMEEVTVRLDQGDDVLEVATFSFR
ncbi:MAG: DUF2135 domain-containing protein [Bacteroidia bacterium]|nr:DUF2135 domain-containing protein [Bacteroidia bacterium]